MRGAPRSRVRHGRLHKLDREASTSYRSCSVGAGAGGPRAQGRVVAESSVEATTVTAARDFPRPPARGTAYRRVGTTAQSLLVSQNLDVPPAAVRDWSSHATGPRCRRSRCWVCSARPAPAKPHGSKPSRAFARPHAVRSSSAGRPCSHRLDTSMCPPGTPHRQRGRRKRYCFPI